MMVDVAKGVVRASISSCSGTGRDVVVLHALSRSNYLNGRIGQITGPLNDTERYPVRLDGAEKTVLIKSENLRPDMLSDFVEHQLRRAA